MASARNQRTQHQGQAKQETLKGGKGTTGERGRKEGYDGMSEGEQDVRYQKPKIR